MAVGEATGADVEAFLREAMEKLAPAVAEVVARRSTGHLEIHFANGKYKIVRYNGTI